jgi:hypothetical protein
MSLDVDLMVVKPVSVYSANITHNLGKMANAVVFDNGVTLYHILWRPEEKEFYFAKDIVDFLYIAWKELISHPDEYKQFNPENGWGSYDSLVNFVKNYHAACMENLDAEIKVCR